MQRCTRVRLPGPEPRQSRWGDVATASGYAR